MLDQFLDRHCHSPFVDKGRTVTPVRPSNPASPFHASPLVRTSWAFTGCEARKCRIVTPTREALLRRGRLAGREGMLPLAKPITRCRPSFRGDRKPPLEALPPTGTRSRLTRPRGRAPLKLCP